MKTILFQGDSITDCGRSRENSEQIGGGYPAYVKAQLEREKPGQYQFLNRGTSGNRVVDLYARIKADIINLQPDYMSILIGVNDVLHEFECCNGVEADKFEKIYCMLIEEIKEALPDIRIMILEPFSLSAALTENTEEYPDKWNIFSTEVKKRAEKARRVAEKYDLIFVPLQDKFDEAARNGKNTDWLRDGVHPTVEGYEMIKREWLEAFEKMTRAEKKGKE